MWRRLRITLILTAIFALILDISLAILIRNANKIIKYELETRLGKYFSIKKIELYWGCVEAFNISFKNTNGKEIFKSDKLVLEADFLGVLKKEYIISKVSFENPYLFIEKDSSGKLIYPLPKIETNVAISPIFNLQLNHP